MDWQELEYCWDYYNMLALSQLIVGTTVIPILDDFLVAFPILVTMIGTPWEL